MCEDIQADVEDGQLQFFYVLAFVLQGDISARPSGRVRRVRPALIAPVCAGSSPAAASCLLPVWVLVFLGQKCSQASKEAESRAVSPEAQVPTSQELLVLFPSPGSGPVRSFTGRAEAFPCLFARTCLIGTWNVFLNKRLEPFTSATTGNLVQMSAVYRTRRWCTQPPCRSRLPRYHLLRRALAAVDAWNRAAFPSQYQGLFWVQFRPSWFQIVRWRTKGQCSGAGGSLI